MKINPRQVIAVGSNDCSIASLVAYTVIQFETTEREWSHEVSFWAIAKSLESAPLAIETLREIAGQ
jgi:hypothetical protein